MANSSCAVRRQECQPEFFAISIPHHEDAVSPATIFGLPPMEDFHLGGASVKLFLPIFKMNFPEIVDIALPAEGVFHNLVFVSIRKTYPMQAYKIMHGLWGMPQIIRRQNPARQQRVVGHGVQPGLALRFARGFNYGPAFSST